MTQPVLPVAGQELTVRHFAGDIWRLHARGLWLVDPTNAFVRNDGSNVMGAGISRQAKGRFPDLPAWYGARLLADVRPSRPAGEPVVADDIADRQLLVADESRRLLFAPVKLNWWQAADPALVERSLAEISAWLRDNPDAEVALPRLGCGNGGLNWDRVVRPLVRAMLLGLAEPDRRRVVLVKPLNE